MGCLLNIANKNIFPLQNTPSSADGHWKCRIYPVAHSRRVCKGTDNGATHRVASGVSGKPTRIRPLGLEDAAPSRLPEGNGWVEVGRCFTTSVRDLFKHLVHYTAGATADKLSPSTQFFKRKVPPPGSFSQCHDFELAANDKHWLISFQWPDSNMHSLWLSHDHTQYEAVKWYWNSRVFKNFV